MTTNSQNDLDKQIDAAFEVFFEDYRAKSPSLSHPDTNEIIIGLVRQSVKEVFSAGFSSAYASYIVAINTRGVKRD